MIMIIIIWSNKFKSKNTQAIENQLSQSQNLKYKKFKGWLFDLHNKLVYQILAMAWWGHGEKKLLINYKIYQSTREN